MWKVEADGSITGPRNLGWFYPLDINNYGVMAGVLWTDEYEFHPVVAWVDENDVLQIPTNTSPPPVSADVAALNDYDVGDPLLTVVGTCYNADGAARIRLETMGLRRPDDGDGHAWRARQSRL